MLLYNPQGKLEQTIPGTSLIRLYGPGGFEILDKTDPANPPAPANATNATPPDNILAAIEETALRYGRHTALRHAKLSVSDWMALFQANIEVESAYRLDAVSHAGAYGLGQLTQETASELGVDRTDMNQNLDGSARYLLLLLAKFQSAELALAGYNAGPKAVEIHGGIPPYEETHGHVTKVMAVFSRLKGDV